MQISEASARTPPVEVSEARDPWLIEHFQLAQDSGGPGQFRGGLGVDLRMLTREPAVLTTVIERTSNQPWGLAGGLPGRPNGATLTLPDASQRPLTKLTRIMIPSGSVVEVRSGGGGPMPAAVQRDMGSDALDERALIGGLTSSLASGAMDLKRMADKAKRVIDERGGTEQIRRDADRLRGIATGPGTAKQKAEAAGEALKQPRRATSGAPSDANRGGS